MNNDERAKRIAEAVRDISADICDEAYNDSATLLTAEARIRSLDLDAIIASVPGPHAQMNQPRRNDWEKAVLPWSEYPTGTKARCSWEGGFWLKIDTGWRWHLGSIFPTPGAANEVLLATQPKESHEKD